MDIQMTQLELNLFLNLLQDYLCQQTEPLKRLQTQISYLEPQGSQDYFQQLLTCAKYVNNHMQLLFSQTKFFYKDTKMQFVHEFYQHCGKVQQQLSKKLAEGLQQRINSSIQMAGNKQKTKIQLMKRTKPERPSELDQEGFVNADQMKRATRQISRDLENIDYYLNLFTYEDNKQYEERQKQYQKLLSHRRSLDTINPSQAQKQIMQTANMIEGAIETADKIFQQSYLINYVEFKTHFATIQDSESIVDVFRKDVEASTKDKFVQAIIRGIEKYIEIENAHKRKHRMESGIQTEQNYRMKVQDKWQNLLVNQKKNNQKLQKQLNQLKKNIATANEKVDFKKNAEKEEAKYKELQGKYLILETMYNGKCNELSKFQRQASYHENIKKSSAACQTIQTLIKRTEDSGVQTDKHFYYHFENVYIEELQEKINELQKIINHKEYVIKEMEAVKTFRDNFKSKKQIFSALFVPKKKSNDAKSLHYLQQEDQKDCLNEKDETFLNSISSSAKKIVTFGENNPDKHNFPLKKKARSMKKMTTFCEFSDRVIVENQVDRLIQLKSQTQPHEISLKSILKVGNSGSIKITQGTQTVAQCQEEQRISNPISPDQSIKNKRQSLSLRKQLIDAVMESRRSSIVDLSHIRKQQYVPKSRYRPSLASTVRQFKKMPIHNFVDVRNSKKASNEADFTVVHDEMGKTLPPVNRKSQVFSPLAKKSSHERITMLKSNNKYLDSRFNTLGETLHVNNSLNFNLVESINLPKKSPKLNEKQNRGHGKILQPRMQKRR